MLEKILEVAALSGEVVRSGYRQKIEIEYKTNDSNLVTEIDKKSEKLIVDYISKNFPAHGILAEEGSDKNRGSEYLWVIDPLDGTTNFAHGLPIFSVSIGLMKNGEIIAGVVNDVMRGKIYYAEKGAGAFEGGRKLAISKNDTLKHSLLVTGFPYDIADNPGHALEIFVDFIKRARAVRRLGSAAIDFCFVADGIFDAFWEVHLHPWDICAGKLLVEEAGGIVTDFSGNETDIFTKQVLASNRLVQDEIVSVIKPYFKA